MRAFPPLKSNAVALGARAIGADPSTAGEDVGQRVVDRVMGSIIRQVCKLTDAQIEQILIHQRERGLRFGEAAIELKLASKSDVTWALSQQFHYPYASAEGASFNHELVVAVDPFGDQAEAFRELRSQLLAGVLAGDKPRHALAILSAGAGDGKSYFAANMAITLSQLGGQTLLVDADMRTPRQHELFDVPNHVGLSGVLSGRSGSDVIYRVQELPSLYVLPVGTPPPNPLELVHRAAFGLLLREMLGKFDHVVVDTPAASHGPDGRAVAAQCGAALVIGRRHVSAVGPMKALLRALAKSQIELAGVLINEHRGVTTSTPAKERTRWSFRGS
jgi:chain length determinant protein tyrosine kinase EpsG